jgi:hypothetical protein
MHAYDACVDNEQLIALACGGGVMALQTDPMNQLQGMALRMHPCIATAGTTRC